MSLQFVALLAVKVFISFSRNRHKEFIWHHNTGKKITLASWWSPYWFVNIDIYFSNRRRQPSGSSLSSLGPPPPSSLSPSPLPQPPCSPHPSPKIPRPSDRSSAAASAAGGLRPPFDGSPGGVADTDQLLPTPPGSPSSAHWRSRLNSLKNNFLGSPRFHRRKLHGENDECHFSGLIKVVFIDFLPIQQ
jgi:hypothetical protein